MSSSTVTIEPITTQHDVADLARIVQCTFQHQQSRSGVFEDIADYDIARAVVAENIRRGFSGFLARAPDGTVMGLNFLTDTAASPVRGIGPVTVAPEFQGRGVGKQLMRAVLQQAETDHAQSVRLCVDEHHDVALPLYTSLGFTERDIWTWVSGIPMLTAADDNLLRTLSVRRMTQSDVVAVSQMLQLACGVDRSHHVRDCVQHNDASSPIDYLTPVVCEQDGQLRGFATGFDVDRCAVATTHDTAVSLLLHIARSVTSSGSKSSASFLIPSRYETLLQWCLQRGLTIRKRMRFMTRGKDAAISDQVIYIPTIDGA